MGIFEKNLDKYNPYTKQLERASIGELGQGNVIVLQLPPCISNTTSILSFVVPYTCVIDAAWTNYVVSPSITSGGSITLSISAGTDNNINIASNHNVIGSNNTPKAITISSRPVLYSGNAVTIMHVVSNHNVTNAGSGGCITLALQKRDEKIGVS